MERERPAKMKRKGEGEERDRRLKGPPTPTVQAPPNLPEAIRALSVHIKRHVDDQSKGKAEEDAEIIKLNRQERNFNAVALSLSKSIEEANTKASSPTKQLAKHAGEKAKLKEEHNKSQVKRSTAIVEKTDTTIKRRTASEVCDTAYGAALPSVNKGKKPEANEATKGKPAPRALPSFVRKKDLASTRVGPGMEKADAAAKTPAKPRIQMPPFVINPHRDAKEKFGPDEHYKEKDFGASCREMCKYPPREGETNIEAHSLRKHVWQLSLVANLPRRPGYANEEEDGDKGIHEDASSTRKNRPYQDDELEDYVSETDAPARIGHRQSKTEPKKTGFNMQAFQLRDGRPSSFGNTLQDEGAAEMHVQKGYKVRSNNIERQGTAMAKDLSGAPPPSGKTFSMNAALPKHGRNVRGRFFDPRDPRRDTLRKRSLRNLQESILPLKRARSLSSDRVVRDKQIPVCRSCWQRGDWCTGHVKCKPCNDKNRYCESVWCRFGLSCRSSKCVYLHPGQVEGDGERRVADGDLGRRNSLR